MALAKDVAYIVVEFEKEAGFSTMEVVPDNWRDLEGNQCILYPYHYSSERVLRAARRGEVPTYQWKSFPVRKEWYKTKSWAAANSRCDKLLDTSNVDTEEEEDIMMGKRIPKLPKRYVQSTSVERQETVTAESSPMEVAQSHDNVMDLPSPPNAPVMFGSNSLRNIGSQRLHTPSARQSLPMHGPAFSTPERSSDHPMPPYDGRHAAAATTHDHAFEARVFGLFERVLEKLRAHEVILQGIAGRQNYLDEPQNEEEALPQLPCASVDALQGLEDCLTHSEAARKKLTRTLSLVGGYHLKSVIANMLKEVLTHDLSKQHNQTGTKGKACFAKHKTLNKVLFQSIRRTNGHKDETDKDIFVAMGKWFTNARDRNGDRKARLSLAAATGIGDDAENGQLD